MRQRGGLIRCLLVEAFLFIFKRSLSGLLRYDVAIPWGDDFFTGILFLRGKGGAGGGGEAWCTWYSCLHQLGGGIVFSLS